MTTVLASFEVADFDKWRAGYAHAVNDPELRSWSVFRNQDNPKHIVITETFDTREYAEKTFTSDAVRDAMTADGVDLSTLRVVYLDKAP